MIPLPSHFFVRVRKLPVFVSENFILVLFLAYFGYSLATDISVALFTTMLLILSYT